VNSNEIRELAEDNLKFVLERARQNSGRLEIDDAASAQFFCRVVEAETNGGAYGITTYLNGTNRDSVLAAASRAVRVGEPA